VSQLLQAHLIAFFTASELREAARERERREDTHRGKPEREEEGTRHNNALEEGERYAGIKLCATLRGSSFRGTICARRDPRDPRPEFVG